MAALLTMIIRVVLMSCARSVSMCACGRISFHRGSSQGSLGIVNLCSSETLVIVGGFGWMISWISSRTWMCCKVCVGITGTILDGLVVILGLLRYVIWFGHHWCG